MESNQTEQEREITIIIINEKEKKRYVELVAKLDTLSPLKTLMRGYSIAEKEGKIVKSIEELKKDDNIDIRLTDGKVQAKVL